MTDNQSSSSRSAIQPGRPDEQRPAAAPGAALPDGRRGLHDQQRDLVRASLIARPPGDRR
jgi:hypothetical protein